ncbi:MAG TPA: hypothetical protein VGX76_01665 [Pirellulales bacterium]|jgi:hypothetical protein|nr:hypothetical protein [Pirellulales bacterium]
MGRRFQFSLRTALLLVLVAGPTASVLRTYLANRGLVPITGLVVLKGKPLANAAITLVPQVPGPKPVRGTTDAAGRFQTETPATPGTYGVAIAEATGGASSRISPKLKSNAMSGLVVEVQAGLDNELFFSLSD